ncbi:MAG: endolytic transglycosylase MltG [Bacteroidales bacterium]|nr:endolytic transglycosylase MltG [Bacteroidales bacterium]
MRRGWIWAGAAAALVVAVAGIHAYRYYYDRKVPNFSGTFELYVRPDMAPSEVLDSMLASGYVLKPRSLRRALEYEGGLAAMQVGHYTVDPSASSMYVARMLTKGWQTPVNLTLSGAIRSPGVLARKIGAQMLADSAAVASFLYSNDSLARYGVDTTLLFCLVIPDTYQMKWTASVSEIFDRFRKEHDAYWTPERERQAREQGLTLVEVATLASIVDGETRYVPEQPTIAGVYLNRLRIGMKLQADPTVAYCYGYTLNRILRKHLDVDSPYNTYKYAGLPPGPISCPPKTCLEAVLHPERHGYLYFCANPAFNGSHLFASTYAEHLDNARAFQKALTERLKNHR